MTEQLWTRAVDVERQYAEADAAGGGTIQYPAGEFATGVFRRVTVAGPSVFVISGNFTDINDMWDAIRDGRRHVQIQTMREVEEETP